MVYFFLYIMGNKQQFMFFFSSLLGYLKTSRIYGTGKVVWCFFCSTSVVAHFNEANN